MAEMNTLWHGKHRVARIMAGQLNYPRWSSSGVVCNQGNSRIVNPKSNHSTDNNNLPRPLHLEKAAMEIIRTPLSLKSKVDHKFVDCTPTKKLLVGDPIYSTRVAFNGAILAHQGLFQLHDQNDNQNKIYKMSDFFHFNNYSPSLALHKDQTIKFSEEPFHNNIIIRDFIRNRILPKSQTDSALLQSFLIDFMDGRRPWFDSDDFEKLLAAVHFYQMKFTDETFFENDDEDDIIFL